MEKEIVSMNPSEPKRVTGKASKHARRRRENPGERMRSSPDEAG
jgi:hypothetical protein